MSLSEEVLQSIESSVLCWLATSSVDGVPNVSPKEVFAPIGEDAIAIANIASPGSAKNIAANANVCVSFVDIFVQKGFQLHGTATIIERNDARYRQLEEPLLELTQGKFPFATIFEVVVRNVKPIIAPRYVMYPETTEAQQIKSAKQMYGLISGELSSD